MPTKLRQLNQFPLVVEKPTDDFDAPIAALYADGRVVEYTARGAAGGFKNGSIATSRSGANEPHSPYLMIHLCGRVLTSSQPG